MDEYYEKYAYDLFLKSRMALLSHKRRDDKGNTKGFIRTSKQYDPTNSDVRMEIFPTATFQGYSALLDSEIHLKEKDRKKDYLVDIEEVKQLIGKDDIVRYAETSTNSNIRSIFLFEHILYIFARLKEEDSKFEPPLSFEDVKIYITGKDVAEKDKRWENYFPDVGRSPWFLLIALNCQSYVDIVYGPKYKLLLEDGDDDEGEKGINETIDNHINYHMARYNVKEHSFDPVSLAVAVCCKLKRDPSFKNSPFFVYCLRAIFEQQYADGSMPMGATVAFDDSGNVMQQASVQVVSMVAEAIVDYKFLVDSNDYIMEILEIICPAFRKLAGYLESNYESAGIEGRQPVYGWGSDRLKMKNFTETWITSCACRFFHRYWLIEKAYLRIKSLNFLGVEHYSYENSLEKAEKRWRELIEPDRILKPKETLSKIIQPILEKRRQGKLLILPDEVKEGSDLVSFIICGPPGSGKTYIVKEMARAIGWPLIELSPSQFIKEGLEFIESTSKKIFDAICTLHHAVVFFDECDELFRTRQHEDKMASSSRTILNFLTASMLPKLQTLHDKKNVIFVLGTNYLYKIDDAVRRDGRFDFRIIYDRLDDEARKKYYLNNIENASQDDAESFAKRTVSATFKELGKYLHNNAVHEIDEDYQKWCKEVAKQELKATKYPENTKKLKRRQWVSFSEN